MPSDTNYADTTTGKRTPAPATPTCGKVERFQATVKRLAGTTRPAQHDPAAAAADRRLRRRYTQRRPHRSATQRPRPATRPCPAPPQPATGTPTPTTGSAATPSTRPAPSPLQSTADSEKQETLEPLRVRGFLMSPREDFVAGAKFEPTTSGFWVVVLGTARRYSRTMLTGISLLGRADPAVPIAAPHWVERLSTP